VDLLLVELLIEMSEKPDADEFLVGKIRLGIVTCAPETSSGTSIVNLTDKQINLTLVDFPW